MAEAIDFKKVNSRKYKAWRILSAPGIWSSVYSDREKEYRDFNSVVIFPEQLLGLNQALIYKVTVNRVGPEVSSQITAIRNFEPVGISGEVLDSLKAIREYEEEYRNSGDAHKICLGTPNNRNSFYNHAFFTNSKDAIKYQQKLQLSLLSQIG